MSAYIFVRDIGFTHSCDGDLVLRYVSHLRTLRAMRLFLLSLTLIVLLGCERPPTSPDKTAEVRLKGALKLLLLEARLIAVDDAAVFHSIDDLIAMLDEKGHLEPFASYGRTNIFFNPDLTIWSMTEGGIIAVSFLLS